MVIPIDHVPEKHLKYWREYICTRRDDDFLVGIRERQVRYVIEKHSKKWINGRIYPHALRHSCGVYLTTELNLPVQDVQKIMRHTNSDVTLRYVRLKNSDLKEKLRKVNE